MSTAQASSTIATDDFPVKVYTKIVGTTFDNRQAILRACKARNIQILDVIHDYENPVDPFAVALEATFRGWVTTCASCGKNVMNPQKTDKCAQCGSDQVVCNEQDKVLRLGYLSNSERTCMGSLQDGSPCGYIVDGGTWSRSRTYICDKCNTIQNVRDPGDTFMCENCGKQCGKSECRTVVCIRCHSAIWARTGLAVKFATAMANGIQYVARVQEYTGGDLDSNGKPKTLGCNVVIERVESSII